MRNIKKLRERLGITQRELSDLSGIPRTYIVYLESDDCTQMSEKRIKQLCESLKVNRFELLGLNNLKYIPETKEETLYLISLLEGMMKKWE